MIEFKHSPSSQPKKRKKEKVVIPSERVKRRDLPSYKSAFIAVRPPAPYTVTAEEKKGQVQRLPAGTFVGKIRSDQNALGIYRRKKEGSDHASAVKGHSVPYMIRDDKDVRKKVEDKVADGMAKRFQHHLDQELKKQL